MNSAESFTVARQVQCIFALVLLMGISACKPAEPESYAVGITGYNFTAEGVQEFYVNEQWGSNISPYGGGWHNLLHHFARQMAARAGSQD